MTEAQIRATLAQDDKLASEHPDWGAFLVWAVRQRALYDASRREWRRQSPALDVAAVESAYELTPAALSIAARSPTVPVPFATQE
jgi:hypothetical protein